MPNTLTDKAVEHIKATSVRREVPDAGKPGLYLVVQPTGSKSWAVRYRVKGNPAPKKLTLGPALSHKEAEKFIEQEIITREDLRSPTIGKPMVLSGARILAQVALDQAKMKIDPAKLKKAGPPEGQLVGEVIQEFLEQFVRPNNRKTTRRELARILRFRAAPDDDRKFLPIPGKTALWAGRRIREVSKTDVLAHVKTINAPVMANRTFAALRRLFNWCVDQDKIAVSPLDGSTAPNIERSRDRVLNNRELAALWTIAAKEPYPFGPLIQLLILTGQRREEVAGLRWREINFGEQMWTIPAVRVKNGLTHEVPLSQHAMDILSRLPRVDSPEGLVFSTNGKTSISGFSRLKARLDRGLQAVEPWTIHDIRRTVASGMAGLGIPLPVVEKVLNHISESFGGIVGVYQRHEFKKEKRAALDAWGEYVTNLPTALPKNVVALRGAA